MPGTHPEAAHTMSPTATLNAKVVLLAVATVATYVLSLYVLHRRLAGLEASMLQHGLVYAPYDGVYNLGAGIEVILGALALIESLLLAALYRALNSAHGRAVETALAVGASIMLIASFQARFTTHDLYHYVYYGKAGSLAGSYTAVPHPRYPPEFGGLRTALEEPVPPSVYGPLWQEVDLLVVGPTRTLAGAVRAVRLSNIAALLVFFGALVMLRLRVALLAVIVLNPALYYLFVMQGHNDIFSVSAITLGLAVLRQNVPVAVALGAAAALVKVSTIGVALATLCTFGALRTRLGSAFAMVGVSVAVSLVLGGSAYTQAMFYVGSQQAGSQSSVLAHAIRLGVQGLLALIALAAIVASIGYRRFIPTAVFAFPAISGVVHPWYFGWGLPYALAHDRTAAVAASALPLIVFLTDSALISTFHVSHFTTAFFLAIAIAALITVYRRRSMLPLST